jgi:hypothetical protein
LSANDILVYARARAGSASSSAICRTVAIATSRRRSGGDGRILIGRIVVSRFVVHLARRVWRRQPRFLTVFTSLQTRCLASKRTAPQRDNHGR